LTQASTNAIENIIKIHYYSHSCSCYSNTKKEKTGLAFEIASNIALPAFAKLLGYDTAKDVLQGTC